MVTLEFEVKEYKSSIIPGIYQIKGTTEDNVDVTVEISEKLGLEYSVGEKLSLFIGKTRPKDVKEDSYCGKAFLYAIKDKEKKKIYLFSVGGFIIRLESPRKFKNMEVTEEFYFCLNKI